MFFVGLRKIIAVRLCAWGLGVPGCTHLYRLVPALPVCFFSLMLKMFPLPDS